MLLSKFNNEVLVNGPKAVLPQNLPMEWLRILEESSDDFLDQYFSEDICLSAADVEDPILNSCVYELLIYQMGPDKEISADILAEKATVYAIAVLMESVNRLNRIPLEPPTLDNIFSVDRLVAYKTINPAFVKALEESCILRSNESDWLQNIKNKISRAITGK